MHKGFIYKNIIFMDETDSTNEIAKDLAKKGGKEGTIVIAFCQRCGKGRMGRTWLSNKGEGIYMSIILRPDFAPIFASKITHLAGMGVAQAIRKATNLNTYIKWPNDIILNQKKVAGILTEVSTRVDHINFAVLGIGINLNQKSFPKELENKATSLLIETGDKFNIEVFAEYVIEEIENYYLSYADNPDFSLYVDEYKSQLLNINREVIVMERGSTIRGICFDVNHDGELVVKTEENNIITIKAGDTSVACANGYI